MFISNTKKKELEADISKLEQKTQELQWQLNAIVRYLDIEQNDYIATNIVTGYHKKSKRKR
jgi:hypothetical protein